MRRTFAALVVAGAALALAPPAAPHGGLVIVKVCGASGCRAIDAGVELLPPHYAHPSKQDELDEAPPLGPHYELVVSNERLRAWYVPDPGVLRARPSEDATWTTWLRFDRKAEKRLRAVLRGLAPFPEPSVDRISIGGRRASDPERYTALFDPALERGPAPPWEAKQLRVSVRFDRPNPWADASVRLFYAPRRDALWRDGEWFRVSPDLARALEHPEGGGLRWEVVAGLAGPATVLGLALALWLLTGRRRARTARTV